MSVAYNTHPTIGVLFALQEEAKPFQKMVQLARGDGNDKSDSNSKNHITTDGKIAGVAVRIACSGVGMRKATLAAEMMDLPSLHLHLKCLVICGFGGGLRSEIAPGDLVVASTVLDISADVPIICKDSPLLSTAESFRLPPQTKNSLHRGTLATGNRILITREEKQALATRTEALAVDMETAGAVRVAERYGVPWLAVRAISDGVDDDMPLDFNLLATSDGDVDQGRVLRATLAHPWKIPALIRLGARSARAAHNLALFLEAFVTTWATTNQP